jgi:hypothetical protein
MRKLVSRWIHKTRAFAHPVMTLLSSYSIRNCIMGSHDIKSLDRPQAPTPHLLLPPELSRA